MKEILIATNNQGKAKDFESLFKPYGIKVLTLYDIEGNIDVEETGQTFEENAILKAETVAAILGKIVIADDSGLEIDALNGAPGVYSARYAGVGKNDDDNIDKVLKELKSIPQYKRTARFQCVLAIAGPSIETQTFIGTLEGTITEERIGTNGFGYDPIFYVKEKGKTLAELTTEQKSEISHRGNALKELQFVLPRIVSNEGNTK